MIFVNLHLVVGPDIRSVQALSCAVSARAALQTVKWRVSLRELHLSAVEHLRAQTALTGNVTLPFWDSAPAVVFLAKASDAPVQACSRQLLSGAKPQLFSPIMLCLKGFLLL